MRKYRPPLTSTDSALASFDRFIQAWVPQGLHDEMFGHAFNPAEKVRRAIRGITDQRQLALAEPPMGWAVFHEYLDRELGRKDGLGYDCVSNIFDIPPTNALAYAKREWPNKHFLIGEIRAL